MDKDGARLPELVVLPTMSPLRGSNGYCKLLKGEFSDYQRTGMLENARKVNYNIFIYDNYKKHKNKRAGKFQSRHVLIGVFNRLQ